MTKLVKIECLQPGLLTTVQDQGRSGLQHMGIPCGGAMDKQSARLANALVGNPPGAPVLEITVVGPHLKFHQECQVALTGARTPVLLDGHALPFYQTVDIPAGATMRLGKVISGCRTYLAVQGKWNVKQWFNSASALTSTRQVHTPFAYLHRGLMLEVESGEPVHRAAIPAHPWMDYTDFPRVRVMPGPEFSETDNRSLELLLSQTFTVSRDSNRMGYRLKSRINLPEASRDILSSAILPGTIQLTSSGQPILLLADAQTTGGYYRVAQVIAADIDILGQLKPGDEIGFIMVSPVGAQKAREEYKYREEVMLASIQAARRQGNG